MQPSSNNGLHALSEFQPTFTYPIFGEAEQIFGYKDLEIDLKFAAHDMRPNVKISYAKKFQTVGDTSAIDLIGTLKEYLPPVAFQTDFQQSLQGETLRSWTPPGERVQTYSRNGNDYEIWAASLTDPRMRTLVDNIQIMILMYIEGGTFINLDDVEWTLDRWRVYLSYKKSKVPEDSKASPYSFLGYSTTYRFYRFQSPTSDQNTLPNSLEPFPPTAELSAKMLPSRLRISQFLILPDYQRGGHGSALYNAIYDEALADPTITELTVEDPSEEFDKLRDVNDFKTLRPEFEKAGVRINTEPFMKAERGRIKQVPTSTLLPRSTLKALQQRYKIAGRQFARLTELYLLANIGFSHRSLGGGSKTALKVKGARASDPDDRSYYWWRILLKQRIFRKNRDVLLQLDFDDRRSKVDDTANGQEDEYEGILILHGTSLQKQQARNGDGAAGPSAGRKRKVVEDDDDDDEDDDPTKRVKA